jgi:hypothetical protein
MTLRQKLAAGLRSQAGAETVATFRSVLSTAKKPGCNLIMTLREDPELFNPQTRPSSLDQLQIYKVCRFVAVLQ